jgi:hypothetical protein
MTVIAVMRCHQEEAPSGTHPVGSAALDSSMLRILGAAVHHLVEPLRDAPVLGIHRVSAAAASWRSQEVRE